MSLQRWPGPGAVPAIAIFRPRPRLPGADSWRMPLYPVAPAVFIIVMFHFLVAANVFNPLDSLVGIELSLLGIPDYQALNGIPAEIS